MIPSRSYNRSRNALRNARNIVLTALVAVGTLVIFGDHAPSVGRHLMSPERAEPVAGAPRILRGGDAWINSGHAPTARPSSSERHAAEPGSQLIDVVTRVRDGDTIVVGLIPIRIANLDCAETGTAAGERATQRMTELVRGQQLTCVLEGHRSWDREVGVCALSDGRDLGEILIAERLCARWR